MTDVNYAELTAIIIDDQEFVRNIVSRMLSQFGFGKVLSANDGGTGLDAVLAHKPDVIICDIGMKPIGGLEFLKNLRASECAHIPVIVMTGDLDQEVMIKAAEYGVSATVLKPVPPSRLREKIDGLFKKKTAEPAPAVLDGPKVNPRDTYANLKAMVVDDQIFIRRIIAGFLRTMGFHLIEEAADGVAAIKLNNAFLPDIILCDIEMEPMDGLTFLHILRTDKTIVNGDTPFIFLSAHTDTETIARARSLGVDAFVVKPPSLEAVAERISFVLSRSTSAGQRRA